MVICNYCNKEAVFTDSKAVYKKSYGMIYLCRPCDAYVGIHRNSGKPLGRLANADLREWRKRAHRVFDPLWRRKIERDNCSKNTARNAGYKWLSEQLDIKESQCHIAYFDIYMCKKVVKVISDI